MNTFILITFFVSIIALSQAYTDCPKLGFVENFDRKRFLGKWYGIESIGYAPKCGSYELFETSDPKKYTMHNQPYDTDIELLEPDNLIDGYSTKSAIEILNESNMRVLYTDYDHYAVMAECKYLANNKVHFAISIGSRQTTLDHDVVEKLKAQIVADYGLDLSSIKIVNHDGCK